MQRNCLLLTVCLFFMARSSAQSCSCESEFLYVKNFIEKNYAGFADKLAIMTQAKYDDMTTKLAALSRDPRHADECLMLITRYLDSFNDDHIQVNPNFGDLQPDSATISRRPIVTIPPKKLKALQRKSTGIEGIYYFNFDSVYKVAVIKDKSPVHDYIGVIIDSKLPSWKKGMIKFAARNLNDSMMKGILYVRNHLPKPEWFYHRTDFIGWDWHREGSIREELDFDYKPVASEKLSDSTLYIKISSFGTSNAKNIDSLFKERADLLSRTPYLILDLRDNGGGSDFAFSPILPWLYTHPTKNIGVDVLSTDANIAGWKKILEDQNIPAETRASINEMIQKMEASKGKLVNIVDDNIDSSYTPTVYPRRVAILINSGCASTTEQFLLFAKQSSKTILIGENTQGTLDYSNMRQASFSCLPYILRYATTRSRRLDINQGIDEKGIKPTIYLKRGTDWMKEAMRILEKR
jgi:hypothetical protein